MPEQPPRRRGRGRPPKSEGLVTAQALLDAAAEVCAERGFDGTTLARIAERGGVSATAVYNHYPNREELLYAAAVQGLERITSLTEGYAGTDRSGAALVEAYLRPEMRTTRRLIAELHLASGRDERLADLLADWHRTRAKALLEELPPGDPSPAATVKALFLLLLGLCHYDDLPAVRASRSSVIDRAEVAVAAIAAVGRVEGA